jgi:hypothetical protein
VAEGGGVVRFSFKDLTPFDEDDDLISGAVSYTYTEEDEEIEVELKLNINKGCVEKIVSFNGEPLSVFETWIEIDWYVK